MASPISLSPKGRLWVKIVEGRGLILSPDARPYCVVEFDRAEFITREPIPGSTTHINNKTNLYWNHDATFDVIESRTPQLIVSVWDRCGNQTNTDTNFIGQLKILPVASSTVNNKVYDNFFKLSNMNFLNGEIRIQLVYKNIDQKTQSKEDFELLKLIGKGSFGKVLQVRKKDTGRIYAMKVLNKKDIIKRNEIAHTLSERNVLASSNNCPFLVGLKFSFQSEEKLYFILDYMNGGELFFHLQRDNSFDEMRARFYVCELIIGLNHLHKHNVVYRDLKPENVLLDSTGHIALTDFGLSKENINFNDTTSTFCGTAEYLAPEVLQGKAYGKAVDWWALGVLFYEMMGGLPPFYSENTNLMYQNILYSDLTFPSHFSHPAKDLLTNLLQRDPTNRLGSGPQGTANIQKHPFFSDIDWQKIERREFTPPFKPTVESELDTSNFSEMFTRERVGESVGGSAPLRESLQRNFVGFTFNGDGGGGSLGDCGGLDRMVLD